MTTFATIEELAAYTGREIAEDNASAALALSMASDAVRAYCMQNISAVANEAYTAEGPDSRVILLPEVPVTAVASVEVDGTALETTEYNWTRTGILSRIGGVWQPDSTEIVITYSHGYATTPGPVKAATLSLAARIIDAPAGVKQETIGAYSVTYSNGVPVLVDTETSNLDQYRVR
jgi:hypothetical protein